ncbi:exodeoxyribonuclease V subunit alpha [Simplicispira suum]|uniref:exodeoxyribonuclease V subunit alpha n=1 Tax=Simplicispira suum TaxID=2109915 RepID=UPI001475B5BE|nr:exodeoxyribonuclease V subunit alpha [Simplicispira suum]
MSTAPSAPDPRSAVLSGLRALADAGLLRPLDWALAQFIAERDPEAAPELLVASALLAHFEGQGHSCLPLGGLRHRLLQLSGWRIAGQEALTALVQSLSPRSADWLAAVRASRCVQAAHTADTDAPLVLGGSPAAPLLYLRRYWNFEQQVAQGLRGRAAPPLDVNEAMVRAWLDRLFDPLPTGGCDWQKLACAIALRSRLTIVTGGPGTGKTYTAARLLAALPAVDSAPERLRVALAAPTGKAAARLRQSLETALTGLQTRVGDALDLGAFAARIGPARTLHALLGARPGTRRLRHHAAAPLDVDVLIVDEASMVHLEMMASLLAALPAHARLVLLGDKDQLASVEAGAVLGDLCEGAEQGHYDAGTVRYAQAVAGVEIPMALRAPSGVAPLLAPNTVMLRASHRFSGSIGALALAVHGGDGARAAKLLASDDSGALQSLEAVDPQAAVDLALAEGPAPSYRDYLLRLAIRPASASDADHSAWAAAVLAAFERFRLLCAVREGPWGAEGLSRAIEHAARSAGLLAGPGAWYAGRPVLVTRNDAEAGVFNGDVGLALSAVGGAGLRVFFADGPRLRSVSVARLAHVETAFAMTVHKAQGSEFEHTALVLPPQAGALLSRELVYTGITRARQVFTLVAPRAGLLAQAVQLRTQRASGLQDLLRREAVQ